MLDKIAKLINAILDWLHPTDMYYKPYESNILGEHIKHYDPNRPQE